MMYVGMYVDVYRWVGVSNMYINGTMHRIIGMYVWCAVACVSMYVSINFAWLSLTPMAINA